MRALLCLRLDEQKNRACFAHTPQSVPMLSNMFVDVLSHLVVLPEPVKNTGNTLLPLAAALHCLAAAERLPQLNWGAVIQGLLGAIPAADAAASAPWPDAVHSPAADVRQAVVALALAHTDATGIGAHTASTYTCIWVLL